MTKPEISERIYNLGKWLKFNMHNPYYYKVKEYERKLIHLKYAKS